MHFPISKTSCSLLYTEFYSKGEYGEIIWRFNPVWVWKLNLYYLYSQVWVLMGFTGGSVVKNPSANAGDWGKPLGWEDSLKKEMATHSSIPASVHEKFHGQRSLAGYSPCCCKGVRHDLVTKQQQQQWILIHLWILHNIQFSSVAQSCLTLCDPMNCSTTGLPVHHQLPESIQTHVRWVGDAIQQSHPLSTPLLLPSIFPSIWVFSNESALCIRWPKYWTFTFNICPFNEHQDWYPLGWTGCISLQSKGLSRVFSNTKVQKHWFFRVSFLYSPTLTSIHSYWKNHSIHIPLISCFGLLLLKNYPG